MSEQHLTVTFSAPAALTREQIAVRLARVGLTIRTVKFQQQGRPREVDPREVAELGDTGLSSYKIADQLGCSPSTVQGILRRR